MVGPAFHFDGSAQSVEKVFDDGQTQTGAADGACPGFVYAIKTIEDTGQFFCRNADAGILHHKLNGFAVLLSTDMYGAFIWRIFYGIVDQIDQNLL